MKKTLIVIACLMGLVFTFTNAQAATIDLTYGNASSYVGHIDDGIPASGTLELGYVTNLITLSAGATPILIGTETYDRIDSTLTPLPPVTAYIGSLPSPPNYSWTLATNDPIYLLGKYDGPNYGDLVWLVDGSIGDVINLPTGAGSNSAGQPYGLSHISGFSTTISVPEAGALLMFGSGLIGLVGYRRVRRMQ